LAHHKKKKELKLWRLPKIEDSRRFWPGLIPTPHYKLGVLLYLFIHKCILAILCLAQGTKLPRKKKMKKKKKKGLAYMRITE
jgi:hypothetical protein